MSTTKIEFAVQMTCEKCVKAVRSALLAVHGINGVNVDLQTATVVVDSSLSTEDIRTTIESTGRKAVVKGVAGHQAAVCILDTGSKNVQGVVRLVQINANTCVIDGTIDGLKPVDHKISIHECGDLSQGCDSVGNYFNPVNNMSQNRVYGDIGNIAAEENGRASFRLEDNVLKLNDVIGRSLVISEVTDGCLSRVSCGIIARSSGLFQNPKMICACDGVSIWDERSKPSML